MQSQSYDEEDEDDVDEREKEEKDYDDGDDRDNNILGSHSLFIHGALPSPQTDTFFLPLSQHLSQRVLCLLQNLKTESDRLGWNKENIVAESSESIQVLCYQPESMFLISLYSLL